MSNMLMKIMDELDLDDETISKLMIICQAEAKNNDFVHCESCDIRFKCLTNKVINESRENR